MERMLDHWAVVTILQDHWAGGAILQDHWAAGGAVVTILLEHWAGWAILLDHWAAGRAGLQATDLWVDLRARLGLADLARGSGSVVHDHCHPKPH